MESDMLMPNLTHRFLFAATALLCTLAAAQTTRPASTHTPPPPRPKSEAVIIAEITAQLASQDPAQHKQAVESIRSRIQTRGLSDLRSYFLRPMMNNKQFTEVADLALEGILASPAETRSVEVVLQMRVKALLALGKTDEALAASKSLFNIASMNGTSEAILAVAECLNAAHPTDPEIFNRFREEQMAGASLPPVTQPVPVKCTVLAAIKVDSKAYDEALKKIPAEDAAGLMARGNLLLLADRVKDARAIFERLYSLAGSDINESSEALARCIKAEDGTIGRANAWVLSIRPKKTGQ